MSDFFADYGLFFVETFTLVLAIIITFAGLMAIALKNKIKAKEGQLHIRSLYEHYQERHLLMAEEVLDKEALKALKKQLKKQSKENKKGVKAAKGSHAKRVFVIEFKGDMQASALDALRAEVDGILHIADKKDEVVVLLESPGGVVHSYGLAAAQLARIKDKGIHLTVIVDKVAASGGYLMAVIADKILAAPFAIIGSIGVVAQLPNLHRWLKEHHVDFEQITAGDYKRTLTVFGKNTPEGRKKFSKEIEVIHQLFKKHVQHYRPSLVMDEVATGEHWLASSAIELGLVDALQTSDAYLLELYQKQQLDLYQVRFEQKAGLKQKLFSQASSLLYKADRFVC